MSTLTQVDRGPAGSWTALAILRPDAGFTQAHAAHKIGYSRNGVAPGQGTPELAVMRHDTAADDHQPSCEATQRKVAPWTDNAAARLGL